MIYKNSKLNLGKFYKNNLLNLMDKLCEHPFKIIRQSVYSPYIIHYYYIIIDI